MEVAKGYIGPFHEPPFNVVHINPIGIATRKYSGKKRLIINLSTPILIMESKVLTV